MEAFRADVRDDGAGDVGVGSYAWSGEYWIGGYSGDGWGCEEGGEEGC